MATVGNTAGPQTRIVADPELCRDCQACTLACSLYHEGQCSVSLARLSVHKEMAKYKFNIVVCRHCASPDCLEACPVEALQQDERGVVTLTDDACIQCGACADACPYGALFRHEASGRYLKCDLCAGREGPLCVQVCPVGALSLAEANVVEEP